MDFDLTLATNNNNSDYQILSVHLYELISRKESELERFIQSKINETQNTYTIRFVKLGTCKTIGYILGVLQEKVNFEY